VVVLLMFTNPHEYDIIFPGSVLIAITGRSGQGIDRVKKLVWSSVGAHDIVSWASGLQALDILKGS